jgi:hypothetical protein
VVIRKFKIYDYTSIRIYWNIHLSLQAFSSPVSKFSFCTLMEINDRYHRVPLLWNLINAPCFVWFEDHLLVSTCPPVGNSATTMWSQSLWQIYTEQCPGFLISRVTLLTCINCLSHVLRLADIHRAWCTRHIVIQVLQNVSFIHFSF